MTARAPSWRGFWLTREALAKRARKGRGSEKIEMGAAIVLEHSDLIGAGTTLRTALNKLEEIGLRGHAVAKRGRVRYQSHLDR